MRHAVLGAGGIGGLIGGSLARSGQDVTLVVRGEQPALLRVESRLLGYFEVELRSVRRLEEPVDVLWITVKATQLEEALRSAPAGVAGDALVIPLLNGIDHMPTLAAAYGSGRLVAGAIRVESERVEPGHIVQPGPFVELELAGLASEAVRLEAVRAEVAGAGLGCRISQDMDAVLWNKMTMLAPFALCTTAAALPLGGLRVDTVWRQRLVSCSDEVRAVAGACGVTVTGSWEHMLDSAPGDMRSSMQKDVAAGNPSELDAIAGPLLRESRARGVPIPVTEELVRLVRRRVEAG